MHNNKILVAVPVFNETDVRSILLKIKKYPVDLLVIDDGSTKSFRGDLCISDMHLIVHQRNLGYGKTIIDAFTFAIQKDYEYLLTIDGDGQHEPDEIALFLEEIPFYDCDILSGSRYFFPPEAGQEVPLDRYLINKKITRILNKLTGFNLTDSFCGFKAYKVEKLRLLQLTEHGYGMPLQLWIQAWRLGLQVREIPVKLIYKDLTKKFHGILMDPETRLHYYKDIIRKEIHKINQYGRRGLVGKMS